jgi:hypothetical protein
MPNAQLIPRLQSFEPIVPMPTETALTLAGKPR